MEQEEVRKLARQLGWLWIAWSISFSILFLFVVLILTGWIPANELKSPTHRDR
jgi:type IV secretory pathway component VirB8